MHRAIQIVSLNCAMGTISSSTWPFEAKKSSHKARKEGQVKRHAGLKREIVARSFISYSSQTLQLIISFSYHRVFSGLLGVVEVVDKVLDNSGRVGGLDGLSVVGDDGARGGTGNDNTLLALCHRPKRLAYIRIEHDIMHFRNSGGV